jgi:hypothetical protein
MQKPPSQNCQSGFSVRVAPSRHRLRRETIGKKYLCLMLRLGAVVRRVERLHLHSKSFEAVEQQQSGATRAFLKIGDACVGSRPVASLPDEKNETDDQDNDNQHPGLHLDAENVERLNEELHGPRPFIMQGRAFGAKKILFIYCRGGAEAQKTARQISCVSGRGKGEKLVELGRRILDVVRADDEDVPPVGRERLRLGDGGDGPQPNRDRNFVVFRCVDDEGHGRGIRSLAFDAAP